MRVLGPPCHLGRGCWHRYRQDPGSLPGWAAWQYRWGFLSWHSWFGFGERGEGGTTLSPREGGEERQPLSDRHQAPHDARGADCRRACPSTHTVTPLFLELLMGQA